MDLSKSPEARLEWAPVEAVTLGDGFWLARLEANRRRGIPLHLEGMEKHGFIDNFRRVSGRASCERRERFATDADVGKWLEAACWDLAREDDTGLRDKVDAVIEDVIAAQGKDGYLNTWYVFEKSDTRFTEMGGSHELFNAGHLAQAAIAHFRTTGETAFLDAMCRYADYLCDVFDPWKPDSSSGHNGLEPALVELYRITGKAEYLDLTRFLLEWDGFNDRQDIHGHCVRTSYRCAGATDYFLETGDAFCRESIDRQWHDMVSHKIHLHGGIGSRYTHEDFGFPYQLPTRHTYAETCAAIGSIHWNARLLSIAGESACADLMERTLYNGFLSGVSLRGGDYFYVNVLASAGDWQRKSWTEGGWVPCCPPNVLRMMASVPGYFYGRSEEGLWVHLYDNSNLEWELADGRSARIRQETGYPWDGAVNLTVDLEGEASVFLRIPAWCRRAEVRIGDKEMASYPKPGTYFEVRRNWRAGDCVQLTMEMPPETIVASPQARDCAGCAAIQRGPLIYCLENWDNPDIPVFATCLRADDREVSYIPDLLGGVSVIEAQGQVFPESGEDRLYYPIQRRGSGKNRKIRLIPYYAWANRGLSDMTVWMPFEGQVCR